MPEISFPLGSIEKHGPTHLGVPPCSDTNRSRFFRCTNPLELDFLGWNLNEGPIFHQNMLLNCWILKTQILCRNRFLIPKWSWSSWKMKKGTYSSARPCSLPILPNRIPNRYLKRKLYRLLDKCCCTKLELFWYSDSIHCCRDQTRMDRISANRKKNNKSLLPLRSRGYGKINKSQAHRPNRARL